MLHCAIAPDILRCTIIKQPNFEWSDNQSSAAFLLYYCCRPTPFSPPSTWQLAPPATWPLSASLVAMWVRRLTCTAWAACCGSASLGSRPGGDSTWCRWHTRCACVHGEGWVERVHVLLITSQKGSYTPCACKNESHCCKTGAVQGLVVVSKRCGLQQALLTFVQISNTSGRVTCSLARPTCGVTVVCNLAMVNVAVLPSWSSTHAQ